MCQALLWHWGFREGALVPIKDLALEVYLVEQEERGKGPDYPRQGDGRTARRRTPSMLSSSAGLQGAARSHWFCCASPLMGSELTLVMPLTEEVMIFTVSMVTLWTIFSSKSL